MTLKPEEYDLIRQRMLGFKIPYQEIYIELLDHITSDIESRKTGQDLREVSIILEEAITSLGGAKGIEKMAREQEKLYRFKIDRRVWKNYHDHIWWKTLLAVTCSIWCACFIPDTVKYTMGVFGLAVLTLLALQLMVIFNLRTVRLADHKQSLFKVSIRWQAFIPMTLLNLAFIIPNLISTFTHYNAKAFIKIHPIIPLIMFFYILLYAKSCYKVMKEEMRALQVN